jgi:hypothetical protein
LLLETYACGSDYPLLIMAQPEQNQPAMEHQREPCPDRIIDDIGGAFAMGAVGGGAWHLVKGFKNSPSGFRMKGALEVSHDGSPRNDLSLQCVLLMEKCPTQRVNIGLYCCRAFGENRHDWVAASPIGA